MAEKKESGKDLLFSKLLPALSSNPFSATYEGEEPDVYTTVEEEEDELSALRSRLFARPSTYSVASYATINVMENLVLKNIDHVIKRFNACSCDRCRCDVASYALNHLPAKYRVVEPKNVAKKENAETNKQVMDALVNAAIRVRSKPRH